MIVTCEHPYFWRRAAWNKSQESLACSHRRPFRAKAYVIHTLLLCDWSVQQSSNKPQTQKEKNVVWMWAAVSLGGALRDIPKNGCRGDYRNYGWTNFDRLGILVSKKEKFEVLSTQPLNFYRQKPCKIIFAYLKILFSLICGFRIPVFRFQITDSVFEGFPLFFLFFSLKKQSRLKWLIEFCKNNFHMLIKSTLLRNKHPHNQSSFYLCLQG